MNKILFSIIIPAYNEVDYLPACIEACKNQVGNFSYEIIVIDNNSTDNTFVIASDLGVKVIKENRPGVGWARKKGVSESIGEYVVSIDADTHLPIDYLLRVKKIFEKDLDIVCLGGQYNLYDAPWWKDIIWFGVRWFFWFFFYILAPRNRGPIGNNMTFKKEIYQKTSGYDGSLKFGEDFDLCRKLSIFGKVRLVMSLKCSISVRRFRLDCNLWFYFLNVVKMAITGQSYKNELIGHDTQPLTK